LSTRCRRPLRQLAASLLLATLLVLGACASRPAAGAPAESRPLPGAGLPPDATELHLTVIPSPRQAAYGRFLLPLAGHERVDVSSPDFLVVLEELELLSTWRDLPDEGYVLQVGWVDGRTLILLAGADAAGSAWAEEALAQLSWSGLDGSDAQYVRDCLLIDAPGFPLRGNKRPRAWETAYRANFAWGAREGANHQARELVPFFAPGSPLDATRDGLRAALAYFGPWQRRGVRRFAIKFDDVGFALTPASQLAFGAYPRAVSTYMRAVSGALRSVDPEAILYYLPQTYWWDDRRLATFSAALRMSGGLERDVGMVFTGPDVVSETIDAPGLVTARAAFGATQTRALIYDNLGREGDWGPLTGRDSQLVEVADGVFGERGTPVNRLTRLDWSWNPTGYDPERSWRRSILELAGPAGYVALRDACQAFRDGVSRSVAERAIAEYESVDLNDWAGPLPRSEIARLLRSDLSRLSDAPSMP